MATSATSGKCSFCVNKAQYTCPRCNIQYCSSACFKHERHIQCSENFYKDQVKAELDGCGVSEESRKKMLDILKRVDDPNLDVNNEPLDSDDDEEEEELTVRMSGVDLNNSDDVWKMLSDSEREEFRDLVNSGNYEDLLPAWSPWWEQEVPLVEEIKENQNQESALSDCPKILDVPLLSEVMKAKPSSCIPFNILNVISSYCWMVRLFNGDHQESSLDATEALLTLSTVLSANANFESAAIAVDSPRMEAQHHSWLMESEEFGTTVKNDVKKILKGPNSTDPMFYLRTALSDIHSILNTSRASLSKKKKSSRNTRESKSLFASSFAEANQHVDLKVTTLQNVKQSIKKVEFLLSYVKEYSSLLVSLVPT